MRHSTKKFIPATLLIILSPVAWVISYLFYFSRHINCDTPGCFSDWFYPFYLAAPFVLVWLGMCVLLVQIILELRKRSK